MGLVRTKRLTVASLVCALAGSAIVAFAPLGQTTSGGSGGIDGTPVVERTTSVSLVSYEGTWVLWLLAIPVAITLVAVLVPRRGAGIASAVLLWVFCVVGLASIGLFFAPAALLMTFAAAMNDRTMIVPSRI
jgi:hypothetical protein